MKYTNAERADRFERARRECNQHGEQSQTEVSHATGIVKSIISDLENSECERSVGYDKIAVLAEYYGVSADYLLGLSECPSVSQDIQIAQKTIGINHVAMRKLMLEMNTPNKRAFEELLSDKLLTVLLDGITENVRKNREYLKRLLSGEKISERELNEMEYSSRHRVRDYVDDILIEMNRICDYDAVKDEVKEKKEGGYNAD